MFKCFEVVEFGSENFRRVFSEQALPYSGNQSPLGRILVELDYPKFIWISEVSTHRLLNSPSRKDRQCLGRIVVDSTAPGGTAGFILAHFADCLLLNERQVTPPLLDRVQHPLEGKSFLSEFHPLPSSAH